ncbi:hypothetical protein QYM36_001598, partial [Artemia franciscana]
MSEVSVIENFEVAKPIFWVKNLPGDEIKDIESVVRFMLVVDVNHYPTFFKKDLPGLASRKGHKTIKDVSSKQPSSTNATAESCPEEKAVTRQDREKNERHKF